MNSTNKPTDPRAWQNLSKDAKAWELAKTLVDPSDLHALIAKAQEIKDSL